MIVGIDGSNLGPGGSMTHLTNLLAEADPGQHGIARIVVWSSRANLDRLPERPWLQKVHVSVLDGRLHRRLWWQRFALPKLARAACDVLFVPGGNTPARFHPFVAMSRNMLPFDWHELRRYGFSWTTLRLLLLRIGQARTFRRADGLVFLTDYARQRIGGAMRLPRWSAVIPHGVEDRFRMRPRPQQPLSSFSIRQPLRVLYVSMIDLYKHQWHVARAARLLRDAGLPVVFDFLGSAYRPALARFRRDLRELDPQGNFLRYHGPVRFEKLHGWYREADLFVFASSCENLPNVLIEAMAAGLPIACSNRGPMPEVLGDAGLYFDPEQSEEIARAVHTLAGDAELRRRCATAASERAARFSWRRCADETLALVAGTVRDRGQRASVGAANRDLKREVLQFWDASSCGEVYAEGATVPERYEAERRTRYELEPYLRDFARFGDAKDKDVLEIGVGMGADHVELARVGPRSLQGIDLTPRAIEHTRARLAILGLDSKLQVADAERLPFEDASFDVVYSWGVLHHSPDTPQAVAEVWRVLRAGGVARIMIYHQHSLTGYMLWVRYALLRGCPWRSLSDVYWHHLESPGTKAYSVSEAEQMFARFSDVSCRVQLAFADLLEGEVGQRHRGWALSLARRIWPRFLIRRLFRQHGLYLLIEARR